MVSNPAAVLGVFLRWWPIALLLLGAGALYFTPDLSKSLIPETSTIDVNGNGASPANPPEPGSLLGGQMPTLSAPGNDGVAPVVTPVNGVDASALLTSAPAASSSVQPDGISGVTAQSTTSESNKADSVSVLTIRATAETWVEVVDATGRLRIQRVIKVGEVLDFLDASPYVVVIGRADSAQVSVRGRAFDTMAFSRNNVARFEVK